MMDKHPQSSALFAKWRCLITSLLLTGAATAAAAAEVPPLVSGPELGLPSIWRVLLGFLLVAIAAVGAAALLRRLKPLVPLVGGTSSADVLLLSHRQLARNLHVHVVETQQQRFLVVSSPQQLVVTALAQAGSAGDFAAARQE